LFFVSCLPTVTSFSLIEVSWFCQCRFLLFHLRFSKR
jgi:hypothetical protein